MKLPNIHSQRKVMILAFGLILTIFSLSWLIGGGRTNAQSDDIRQPTIAQAATGTGFTYQGKLNLERRVSRWNLYLPSSSYTTR